MHLINTDTLVPRHIMRQAKQCCSTFLDKPDAEFLIVPPANLGLFHGVVRQYSQIEAGWNCDVISNAQPCAGRGQVTDLALHVQITADIGDRARLVHLLTMFVTALTVIHGRDERVFSACVDTAGCVRRLRQAVGRKGVQCLHPIQLVKQTLMQIRRGHFNSPVSFCRLLRQLLLMTGECRVNDTVKTWPGYEFSMMLVFFRLWCIA